MDLEVAIQTFMHGFCCARSLTHPYEIHRAERLWVMRDAPRTKGEARTSEYVAYQIPAPEVAMILRRGPQERFALCVIHAIEENAETIKRAFKAEGFRLLRTEPIFVHALPESPSFKAAFEIRRIRTQDEADRIAKASRSRQILSQHLVEASPLRLYAAWDGERPIGWVRSISTDFASTWISNLYVKTAYRRQGLAKALLSTLLTEDRALGYPCSVLTASHLGAQVYPSAGFEQIGLLQLFSPVKT